MLYFPKCETLIEKIFRATLIDHAIYTHGVDKMSRKMLWMATQVISYSIIPYPLYVPA